LTNAPHQFLAPGRTLAVWRRNGAIGVRWPKGRVVERLTTCGLKPIRDTAWKAQERLSELAGA
jgi:hypothetical protein